MQPTVQPSAHDKRPVAITMGDPAGIGPEIAVALFRHRPGWSRHCAIVGDSPTLQRAADRVAQGLVLHPIRAWSDLATVPLGAAPVWHRPGLTQPLPWGRVDARAGRAAADAVAMAAQAALRGDVAGVVTAPLHKEALAAAGLPYPGHTEYLQALAAQHLGVPVQDLPVRMMLSAPGLNTVLVSIHLSLREALSRVTRDQIGQTLALTAAHFQRFAPGQRCRIAVAGLNPHAGEGGLFGREEIDEIAPAVQAAQARGLDVSGPHAPDTVFMRARQGEFDVVIAMYHDQGLIPVKYLGLADGVNTTIGLPFLRTSPDHGTAFDIAGTGRADPSSLIAATQALLESL